MISLSALDELGPAVLVMTLYHPPTRSTPRVCSSAMVIYKADSMQFLQINLSACGRTGAQDVLTPNKLYMFEFVQTVSTHENFRWASSMMTTS